MSSGSSTRAKKKVSDRKKIKTEEISTKSHYFNDEDLNYSHITLPYDVLRIIFARLPAKDLCNSAMMCKLWQEAAGYELKLRKLITSLVDYEKSFTNCNSEYHFSNELTNKPMLGLFFNSSDCEPPECLGKHLPRSCVSVTVMNSGIISDSEELECCEDKVAYALLPDDPKVDMEFIVATSSQMTRINRKIDKHDNISQPHRISYVEPMINDSLKRLKDVKCMIIFTSEKFRHSEKLYKSNVFKNNVKAVWGGVAEKLFICRTNEAGIPETLDVLWLTILISGPNVKCWSTLVDEKADSDDAVAAALFRLKAQMNLQRHTIGFMFTCVARGSAWYNGMENIESTIFRAIFPEIPLIGSFGNGEYGIHSENQYPFVDGLDQHYSTTFMILTYG